MRLIDHVGIRGVRRSMSFNSWLQRLVANPDGPQRSNAGLNTLLRLACGSAGCGVIGLVTGIFAAGLMPSVSSSLLGGWNVSITIALSSAGVGAVVGMLMSRSASPVES